MTLAELLADITANVTLRLNDGVTVAGGSAGGHHTRDVLVLHTINADGVTQIARQRIYVKDDLTVAYYGGQKITDYVAPTPTVEQDLIDYCDDFVAQLAPVNRWVADARQAPAGFSGLIVRFQNASGGDLTETGAVVSGYSFWIRPILPRPAASPFVRRVPFIN